MKVAAFSDVHSNSLALRAVLEDISEESVDLMICGGDLVGYGSYPNEVIQLIREYKIPTVLGNYDDGVGFDRDDCGCAYTTREEEEIGKRSLEWTKNHVSDGNKAFLRNLPKEIRWNWNGKQVLLVHGSPRRINEYLYENRPERSLLRMLKPLQIDVLIFGHTHIPYHRVVDNVHMLNVGSVGKPKDRDPRACYATIEFGDTLNFKFKRVSYPIEEAVKAIKQSSLPIELADALQKAGK
ncbi:MAG: metallophosphoesterase family protein [Candidatus Bathyarchaeia archaeon]